MQANAWATNSGKHNYGAVPIPPIYYIHNYTQNNIVKKLITGATSCGIIAKNSSK